MGAAGTLLLRLRHIQACDDGCDGDAQMGIPSFPNLS